MIQSRSRHWRLGNHGRERPEAGCIIRRIGKHGLMIVVMVRQASIL
jgi:hypothetical protein